MKRWEVKVTGVGGPMAEFDETVFYVQAAGPGEAVSRAVAAFDERQASKRHESNRYEFVGASVREDEAVRVALA